MEQYLTVVQEGDANGNGMLLRLDFPSGLVIHALPTPNEYGGEWDLGPTWNYLVEGDRPFLVDTGRWGTGGALMKMIVQLGPGRSPEFVVLSHGHEDHDGGLAEVTAQTGAEVRAHAAYCLLARPYPGLAPQEYKRDFPAKCWHCFMPESFYGPNCLGYHRELQDRLVREVGDGRQSLGTDLESRHVPGHCPDSLAVEAGDEAVLVGDTILPDITPWPTGRFMYKLTAPVLGERYPEAGQLYGLPRYLRSLKELRELGQARPGLAVLPAHRLYYQGRFNFLDLAGRVDELLKHHVERCADLLRILKDSPKNAEALARAHFEDAKLSGPGMNMAKNEVVCHCELLMDAGDVVRNADRLWEATGSGNFERFIQEI